MSTTTNEKKDEIRRALKRIRRGRGIFGKQSDSTLEGLGVENWDQLFQMINWFEAVYRQKPSAVAIVLALGIENYVRKQNLTERREGAAQDLEVSLRTVMRLEEEGAELLADFIYRLTNPNAVLAWSYATRSLNLVRLAKFIADNTDSAAASKLDEAATAIEEASELLRSSLS